MTESVQDGIETSRLDLATFDLSDMIECGRAVRDGNAGAASMEAAANAVVRIFHQRLVSRETGEPSLALVRCFKTHRFRQLPEDLKQAARDVLGRGIEPDAEMPALTLLATAGELPEWNDRTASAGHRAIPLVSVEMVERAPMISALLRQMGLQIEAAMYPTAQWILDADQHAFNVFHVEHAPGDARIPAQEGFVRRFGIASVLGFGGLLPSGDLFAVIMFARTRIPRATADLFRTIALSVKLALLPFTRGPVFVEDEPPAALPVAAGTGRAGLLGETEEEQLRSEAATLRLLIPALEEAALHQTRRLMAAVTEAHDQGRQIGRQQLRLSSMLEGTTDSVFLLDRDWRFTFLNGHARDLISLGQDLLGKCVWDLFPDAVGTEFWTQYHRAMYEGRNVEFQEYYPAPLDKWFEVHAFPTDEGIAAFFRDITPRLKSEAALRQSEKLAAVGRLASSIAHEINNPLESVTNLLYLAQRSADAQEVQDYLVLAERELRRVSSITNQTLMFHKHANKPVPVSCDDLTESVLSIYQGRIVNREVRVEERMLCRVQVTCFDGEIRQVLSNLVGNAIDAMPPGGRLLMRSRAGSEWTSGRPGVVMTVGDTGSGMQPEAARRIFEPFFTTKGIGGTGLGLWVSSEIVARHQGTLRVRSKVGTGTVFRLFLPLEAALRDEPAAEPVRFADGKQPARAGIAQNSVTEDRLTGADT